MQAETVSKLFPTLLNRRKDAKENLLKVLKIAFQEGTVWNYLLMNKHRFPGSVSEIINRLHKAELIENVEEFPRGKTPYQLTGKGLLAALRDEKLRTFSSVTRFFKNREIDAKTFRLMRTLKVANLLTKPGSKHSLLTKILEGMMELGWNLENIPENEVNRRLTVLLTHAMALALDPKNGWVRKYVKKNADLMPELEVALKIAENVNLKPLLESKDKCLHYFRLDMSVLTAKFIHAQELMGHYVELFSKSPAIPARINVFKSQEREEIINLWNPYETFACYQQNQLVLHSRVVWPHYVIRALERFLAGKHGLTFCAAMIQKNDHVECFTMEEGKTCSFFHDLTRCPTLTNCARKMKERLENQLKTHGEKQDIPLEPQKSSFSRRRVKAAETGTEHVIYFHYDPVPLEGDR